MAESHDFDPTTGAGAGHPQGHANFVVIDTPTPMPVELMTQDAAPSSPAILAAPVATNPNVTSLPVRTWTLKQRKWSFGLIGPLREVAYVDEKGKDAVSVAFTGGGFSDEVSTVIDRKNNDAKPFKLIHRTSWWSGDKITLQAQAESVPSQDIGSMVETGCTCQGLHKITLGTDVYYMKRYIGELEASSGMRTRFITIFASNHQSPLLHWSENSGKVSIYTHLDVTLMLLILAHFAMRWYSILGQAVVAPTVAELDIASRFMSHPLHQDVLGARPRSRTSAQFLPHQHSASKIQFSAAPKKINVVVLPTTV